MMNSPKKSPPSSKDNKKWRPFTPHPPGKPSFDFAIDENSAPNHSENAFDFANGNGPSSNPNFPIHNVDYRHADVAVSPGGCMGISLATVMNTFRGPSSTASLPTSPLSIHEDNGNIFYRFNKFRTAVQKTLTCQTNKNCQSNPSDISGCYYDRNVSFEQCSTFDRDQSLMHRAASWGTLETDIAHSIGRKPTGTPSNHKVQFHYPPITSVRLRPRTEEDDIKQLFFAPEELDEIEDDRSDTKAADDIETLAVGEANDWSAVPTCTSSIVTASDYDDQDSRSGLMMAAVGASNNVMFDKEGSPRRRESRRLVRGVQIMLREKSTG